MCESSYCQVPLCYEAVIALERKLLATLPNAGCLPTVIRSTYYHFLRTLVSDNNKWSIPRQEKTIILPVVFYECEVWLLALRQEHIKDVWKQGPEKNILT
jgi:hypothetical protein